MASKMSVADIASILWDLRDDACDHPELWTGASAEAMWQAIASLVEEIADGAVVDPLEVVRLVRATAVR